MNEKLLPCPFCGGDAYLVTDDETASLYGVQCFRCDAGIPSEKKTVKEAVEAWNRRASDETD